MGYRNKVVLAAFGLVSAAAISAALATPAHAQEVRRQFDIPAQALSAALIEFSRQSDTVVTAPSRLTRGKAAPMVRGPYTSRQALELLLQGSGLDARQTGTGSWVVTTAGDSGETTSAVNDLSRPDHLQPELVVTGSRIRGANNPSPVIEITHEQVRESGFSDMGDVIRSVPQNYNGGQNPGGAVVVSSGAGNGNVTGGSSLNLRGLGPDATLTLLNGKRLAFNGRAQAIDISTVPVEAVSRIEIVADGASSIYGSDAVAGVVNVILKRDVDGLYSRSRIGFTTEGGGTQYQQSIVGGIEWSDGGFIVSYDFESNDPISAHQRDYLAYMDDPYFLYPEIERHNLLFSGHKSLSDSVTLSFDALYNVRDQFGIYTLPWEVDISKAENSNYFVSPDISIQLGSWKLDLSGSHGRDDLMSTFSIYDHDGSLYFDSESRVRNTTQSIELGSEGPLFEAPGGTARVAFGAGFRRNRFENDLPTMTIDGRQTSYYAYGELLLPLIGSRSNIPLLRRLDTSASVRHENYDGNIGSVTTPKLGMVAALTDEIEFKGSWSRSFKAPTLGQIHTPNSAFLYSVAQFGIGGYAPEAQMMVITGGRAELKPETARNWTATLSIRPIPRLSAQISYFDVKYEGRITVPFASGQTALTDPTLLDFAVLSPSAALQQEMVEAAELGLLNISGSPYNPANVVILQDNRFTNVSAQHVHGVDISADYSVPLATKTFILRGSASRIEGSQQTIAGGNKFDIAGVVYRPPHWRARAGATLRSQSWSLSGFINYIGGVNRVTESAVEFGSSMSTLDFTAIYRPRGLRGLLANLELTATVHNAFDEEPPFLDPGTSTSFMSYDPTNYSPVGRAISVTFAKRW